MLYRISRGIIDERIGDRPKRLKRKENATIVSLEFVSAEKSAIPDKAIKRNNINMLAHRFSVAPMMDWIESLLKSNG